MAGPENPAPERTAMQPSHTTHHPAVTTIRTTPASPTETAVGLVDRVLADADWPLVIFAREMCEFCWAAKNFFAAIEVPYRIVEMDSDELQHNGLSRQVRVELEERSGSHTLPQIYLTGNSMGGATDVFAAWNSGAFQQALNAAGLGFTTPVDLNPYRFLHGWLHSP
jgi:cysteine synthase A